MFLSSSYTSYSLCRFSKTVGFHHLVERQRKFNQTETSNQIIVVKMLLNWNNMYYSHYRIIKCIGFKPIHYVTKLDVMSLSKGLNEFNYVFLSKILPV